MANRQHPVFTACLAREIRELGRHYRARFDADERTINLDGINLPSGWSPRTITVRVELPAHWPQTAPRLVFPWNLRYEKRVPRHLLNSGQWLVRGGQLGDPFIYWPAQWDPQTSTLNGVIDTALADLTRPESTRAEEVDA